MIRQIGFPRQERGVKRNEYQHHYLFIKKYAELAGIQVKWQPGGEIVFCTRTTCFSIEIDGRQSFIDYSDHEELSNYQPGIPYFKYHYHPDLHKAYPMVFPLGPMLDLPASEDYLAFFDLIDQNIYTAAGEVILNCQRPRLNARQRRRNVQRLLKRKYGEMADISFRHHDQLGFWNKHRNCLVAVCVPGARNNMLDRGHYEQLALGACTISPRIRTTLPYGRQLIHGTHYLACRDDYADLIDLVEWCRNNRDQCREIGRQAKAVFQDHCMPVKYWQWIEQCLQQTGKFTKNAPP